jgi:hypothetical protein
MTMRIVDVCVDKVLVFDSIVEMIKLAKSGGYTAKQELNDVIITVNGDSIADYIFRDQVRAQKGYIFTQVGPYPYPSLSKSALQSDKRIQKLIDTRKKLQYSKFVKKQKQKVLEFNLILECCPPMERDEEVWQKGLADQNNHPFGTDCYEYAEDWARLMQKGISDGKRLEDIAYEYSNIANIPYSITEAMYGISVSILSGCWIYGEALRKWHNTFTQIGNEGDIANEGNGVLNRASLTISL